MLIKIDDSVTDYLTRNSSTINKDSEEIIALVNLARSHSEGNHYIIGSLNTLEYLNNLNIFDYYSERVFNYLFNNFSTIGSLEFEITDYIIVKSNEHPFTRIEEGGRLIFEIPLKNFLNSGMLDKTKILCEDMSDYYFFVGITQVFLKENNMNMKISPLAVNGGGYNSYLSYQYNLDNDFMVIAIMDSDQKFPGSQYGQTYRKLNTIFSQYESNSVTDIMVLSVREKENLIPPSIYEIYLNTSHNDAIEKLKLLESHPTHSDKLKYFDYKEGLTKEKLEHQYFQELFEVEQLISCTTDDFAIMESKAVLIKGLGNNPTKDFVKNILGDGLDRILETKRSLPDIPLEVIQELERKIELKQSFFDMFPEDIYEEINGICRKIIAWSVCFPRQSTV